MSTFTAVPQDGDKAQHVIETQDKGKEEPELQVLPPAPQPQLLPGEKVVEAAEEEDAIGKLIDSTIYLTP